MNKRKTIEEMSNHKPFSDGLEVTVDMPNVYQFKGKIVGIASVGVVPNYIVECTDNFIPNDQYPYKVVSMPLSYIYSIE